MSQVEGKQSAILAGTASAAVISLQSREVSKTKSPTGNAPATAGAEATTTQSQPIAAVPAQLAKEQTNSGVTGVTPNPTASPAAPDIHANPKTLSGDELLRTTEFACGVVLRDMQVTVALCKEIIARYADRRSTNRPAGKPTVQEAFAAINLNYDTVRKWIQRERVKEIEKLQITDGSEPETDEPLESLKIGEKIVTPDGNAAEGAHQHVTTDRVDVDETIPGYEEPVRKSYKRSELATPAEAESKKKDAPPMKAVALTAGTVVLVSGRRYIVVRTPDSGDIRKTRLTVREGKWRLTVSLREVKTEEPTARAAVVAETGTKTAMDEVVAVKAGEGNPDPDGIIAEPAKARTKLKKPLYKEGIDFEPAFLTPPQANELFELMKSQPFADNRVSYGPQVFPASRKSNAWKDRYALATNPHPEPAVIRSLRLRLSERYGVPFNSVQCNWHDGNSGVRAHDDPYRVVAMVRLGATRTFEVGDQRRNGGGNFKPYPMPHGSLITFLSGGLAHRMFPDSAAGDCVSLIFRLVTQPQTVASWHDKPTYSKTRATHKKLYDAAVSEYRAAKAKAPESAKALAAVDAATCDNEENRNEVI